MSQRAQELEATYLSTKQLLNTAKSLSRAVEALAEMSDGGDRRGHNELVEAAYAMQHFFQLACAEADRLETSFAEQIRQDTSPRRVAPRALQEA